MVSQFLRSRPGLRWRRRIKRRVPLNMGVKKNCRKTKLCLAELVSWFLLSTL